MWQPIRMSPLRNTCNYVNSENVITPLSLSLPLSLLSLCDVPKQYECNMDCQDSDLPHVQQAPCHRHHHSTRNVPVIQRWVTLTIISSNSTSVPHHSFSRFQESALFCSSGTFCDFPQSTQLQLLTQHVLSYTTLCSVNITLRPGRCWHTAAHLNT